jgi:VPDSG-CTERM motif
MKKILFIGLGIGMLNLVQANTINSTISLGSGTLNGNYAYEYGINLNVPNGQQITGFTLTFSDVTLVQSDRHDDIHVDLLDVNDGNSGRNYYGNYGRGNSIITIPDGDNSSDYFQGQGISLGTEHFSHIGQTLTWTYTLTSDELAVLNSYITDGFFYLGIDPDCGYQCNPRSCCSIQCTTGPHCNNVPDVATTAGLLALSFSGLVLLRRKLCVN